MPNSAYLLSNLLLIGVVVAYDDVDVIQMGLAPNKSAPVDIHHSDYDAEANANNIVETNVAGVGGWGGTCTCPDGNVYQVGDKNDGCGSLACINGISGSCSSNNPGGANRRVTCAQATSRYQHRANTYCSNVVNGGRNRCSGVEQCKAKCNGWATDPQNPSQGTRCAGFSISKNNQETNLCHPAHGAGVASNSYFDLYLVNKCVVTYPNRHPKNWDQGEDFDDKCVQGQDCYNNCQSQCLARAGCTGGYSYYVYNEANYYPKYQCRLFGTANSHASRYNGVTRELESDYLAKTFDC